MSGPETWATVLSDDQRAKLRQLTREAATLERVIRTFSIEVFNALQPYLDASAITAVEDEERFHAWAGADPLIFVMSKTPAGTTASCTRSRRDRPTAPTLPR